MTYPQCLFSLILCKSNRNQKIVRKDFIKLRELVWLMKPIEADRRSINMLLVCPNADIPKWNCDVITLTIKHEQRIPPPLR
mmetsp:Transcript_29279/g.89599  ORF Transcript_29279/g.89599 Transcript_29279/m.89599 type:complete len:81 (-) Transcript_29279:1862-2104(-)